MVDSSSTEERDALIGARRLAWLEAGGGGGALVLLHGIGSAARSFRSQIEGLSGDMRVIAWNAPGYDGSAPLSEDAPDASAYAARLADLLDHLGVARGPLVGHSLGCLIAARFACERPQRVMSLTLASCAIGHARVEPAERARLLASRLDDVAQLGPAGMARKRGPRLLGPDATPAQIEGVVATMAAVDPHGYAQAARMLSGGDLIADVARLPADMPVQIVYGEADVITPPQANQRVAQARPEAPVTVIPRAGHACYVEKAEAFNDAITCFTRSHA
jgi:pimeloyl-ACP methyl ester carboxylesterase